MDPTTDLSMLSLNSKQNELTAADHQIISQDLSETDSEQTLHVLDSRSAADKAQKAVSNCLGVSGILKAVFCRPLGELIKSFFKSASSPIFSDEEHSWEITANNMAPSLLKGRVKTKLFALNTSQGECQDEWKNSVERELTERIISVVNRNESGTESFTSAFKTVYSAARNEQEVNALRAIARALHLEHLI